MKYLIKLSICLILLSGIVLNSFGQTIKERIDQNKEVKVYFMNYDIVHNPNTQPPMGSTNGGTGCPRFTETTPLPAEYAEAAKQVIELMNKGFNTTAFIVGDIANVPVKMKVPGADLYDWLKLGEPLAVNVITTGAYTVENGGLMGEKKLSDFLLMNSTLTVIGITEGKAKALATKIIVWESSPKIPVKECSNYETFVKNFPPFSLIEPFKTSLATKTGDFIEKEMAAYEKAMKKKK